MTDLQRAELIGRVDAPIDSLNTLLQRPDLGRDELLIKHLAERISGLATKIKFIINQTNQTK